MRMRKTRENIVTYLAELWLLAEFCNCGPLLEDMLRDRLVCGIGDEQLQTRLLGEAKLTYAKTVQLAQNMETATMNQKEINSQVSSGRLELDNNSSSSSGAQGRSW